MSIVALVGGYVDLIRGGITASAVLLAIGYCVLVPAAIWAWRRPTRLVAQREAVAGPSYRVASLVSAGTLLLYLVTLAPQTAMWDTSEYIAAAWTFGLPHPPGNPLFVIIGRVFTLLPIAKTVAVRINILAAISSAVAAGAWFLVAERVLVRWLEDRWAVNTGGVVSALIGATAFTVWNQSVVNEKVYTVALAGIAIIVWLGVRWLDEDDGAAADPILVLIAYLLGLGYSNHMAGVLPAPAIALAVILRRPRTLVRWRFIGVCGVAFIVGMTPFATQPIRAAWYPAINEGEPTGCRNGLALSCTFSKGTYDAFRYNFDRKQYAKPSLSDRQAPPAAQVGMWWMYFKWQWVRDAHGEWPTAQAIVASLFLILGFVGAFAHWRRDRTTFWLFGSLMVTTTLALIYYLNFKYGASQPADPGVDKEVRDRDYFYLWSFSAWGVWAGLGLVWLWKSAAELLPKTGASRKRLLFASPVLALAAIPLLANWHSASRSRDHDTSAFAADLLNSVEPYGVLITVGDNDTFPLWYAQEVEGIRRDVVIANTSLLGADWFARQLVRRPVYDYDATAGPVLYRGQPWTKPTGSALRMTLDEADAVPPYAELRGPMAYTAPGIHATIDPRRLEFGVLVRADLFVLRMIADPRRERPIYFARTAASYASSLGLEDHLLIQGLAAKLVTTRVDASRDTTRLPGEGWLDVGRTRQLWDSVFTAPAALIAKGDWIDRPSIGIPYLYVITGAQLSESLHARGDSAAALAVFDTARRIATASRMEVDGRRVLPAVEPLSPHDSGGIPLGARRPDVRSPHP